MKLFYNHITIELLTKIFDYIKETFNKLNLNIRTQIFGEFSKSNEYGIIFTTYYDFDSKEDK